MWLTAAGCRARRERLFKTLTATLPRTPDWVLIADPQHLMYFANYFQTPFVFRTANAAAVLLLGADGTAILVADSMVTVCAEKAHVTESVLPVWYNGKETAPQRSALLMRSVIERLKQCPGKHFAYEASHVPTAITDSLRELRTGVELTPIDAVLHDLKRVKDADEIALMRRSIAAIDAGMAAGRKSIRPGMTELQAYLVVQNAAMENAQEQVQVYGDFVSGPRCEKGGGPPSDRVIQPGDLVLLDFSVVIAGYRGDTATTFTCHGEPTAEQLRLEAACLAAVKAGEKLLKAGQVAKDIDRAVRQVFDVQHLGENFKSHSGHGLGLGHPDPPYIVPNSSDTLLAGEIVTLEPGQYIAGVGGMRFEHNYLVTDTGFEQISQHVCKLQG